MKTNWKKETTYENLESKQTQHRVLRRPGRPGFGSFATGFRHSTEPGCFFANGANFAGLCCFSWGESVTIIEPTKVAPVVVTWNTDYQSDGYQYNGIILNGGSCVSYGPSGMPEGQPIGGAVYTQGSYQWVILPSDGLHAGKNTFTLCGGGSFGTAIHTRLGFNTLVVHISN